MNWRRLLLHSALWALAGSLCLPANGSFREQSSQTYALSASGRVSLENINGDVHIRAWDRNEVRIEAVKLAPSQGELNEARVEVDASQQAISIRTRYPDDANTNRSRVEFTVMVPRAARLDEIRLINGAVDIDGVTGEVNASSVNGPVRAQHIAGDTHLSTVNGTLEATFEKLNGAKRISMNSVNGSIVITIPFDAHAEFNARNVSGGIDNDFGIPVARGRMAGSQLHGVLKGGGTRINLNNVNGPICIFPAVHGRRVRFT
jgi:DUF4097 and DUF4098 domain-containing protein YvlB